MRGASNPVRSLDCFASLAMTDRELVHLFLRVAQADAHVALPPEQAPDRRGDIGGRQARGRNLIQQGLEQMMVLPIDCTRPRARVAPLLATRLAPLVLLAAIPADPAPATIDDQLFSLIRPERRRPGRPLQL
jgi:hypothetical protein